jgi:hypothetical protein
MSNSGSQCRRIARRRIEGENHVENDIAAMAAGAAADEPREECKSPREQKTPVVEPLVQVKTRFVDTACDWTRPIYVNSTNVLSDETAKAILAHNRAGAAQRGWKPTSKSK